MQVIECPHCGSEFEGASAEALIFGCSSDDCPGRHAAIRVAAAGVSLIQHENRWQWLHAITATRSKVAWDDKMLALIAADEMVVNFISDEININPERFRSWRIGAQVESITTRV